MSPSGMSLPHTDNLLTALLLRDTDKRVDKCTCKKQIDRKYRERHRKEINQQRKACRVCKPEKTLEDQTTANTQYKSNGQESEEVSIAMDIRQNHIKIEVEPDLTIYFSDDNSNPITNLPQHEFQIEEESVMGFSNKNRFLSINRNDIKVKKEPCTKEDSNTDTSKELMSIGRSDITIKQEMEIERGFCNKSKSMYMSIQNKRKIKQDPNLKNDDCVNLMYYTPIAQNDMNIKHSGDTGNQSYEDDSKQGEDYTQDDFGSEDGMSSIIQNLNSEHLGTISKDLSEVKPYGCNICNLRFSTRFSVTRHIRTHTGEKPYHCNTCDRHFTSKWSLNNHERIHLGEKPYVCDVCNYRFVQQSCLAKHKKIHTGEKPHGCDVCDRKFNRRSDLVTHKRIHTGEKPYSCDICDLRFANSGSVIRHKLTHTGEKPHSCEICQHKFVRKSDLMSHTRIHSGQKPYVCDICNCDFAQKSYLTKHKKTHTGERPYRCEICERKFSYKSDLIIHQRTHTGERPYSCDICEKKFNRKRDVATHKRTHTGERPYSCHICKRKYSHNRYLKKHISKCSVGDSSPEVRVSQEGLADARNGRGCNKNTGVLEEMNDSQEEGDDSQDEREDSRAELRYIKEEHRDSQGDRRDSQEEA